VIDIQTLGMDLGFGAAKAFTVIDGPVSVALPFVLATYDGRTLDAMGANYRVASRPDVLRVDGVQYLVGTGAEKYSATILEAGDMERLTGPESMLMVYATWARLFGAERHEVVVRHMVAGLPVAVYQGDKESTRAIRDKVRSRFAGEHRFSFNEKDYYVRVEKVAVAPQALGAVTDYFVDLNSRNVHNRENEITAIGPRDLVGAISLGNRTIDMVLLQGTEIVPVGTGGEPLGVRTLLEQVQSRMNGYSLGELDYRLRADKLNCTEEKTLWLRQVSDLVNRRWGSIMERLGRVVLVGGGVHLLPNRDGKPNAAAIGLPADVTYIPDDPVGAVARGLFKLGQSKK